MKFLYKNYLLAVAATLAMIFCGCSDQSSQTNDVYLAEKMFFKAEKLKQDILINPEIASLEEYNQIELAYRDLIGRFSSLTKNSAAVRAIVQRSWLTIAELALMQKKVDTAISVYREIVEKATDDRELCAAAQFSMAQELERTQQLDEAIKAYEVVFRNYPPVLSDTLLPNFRILHTPIYIARLYSKTQQNKLAEQQYDEARKYYEQVIAKWPRTDIAMAAENQIAMSYGDQGNWDKAVAGLENIVQNYSKKPELIGVYFTLGKIYEQQFKNTNRALEIYYRILQQFPEEQNLGQIHLAIATVYFSEKRYEDARKKFLYIIENYRNDENSAINAQLGIARSYEEENNWSKALNEYQWIVENYSKSIHALNVPLYIADHYRLQQEHSLAKSAYEAAIKQYQRTINQFPNTILAAIALDYTVSCYMRLEKWEEAANTLQTLKKIDLPLQNKVKVYLTLENVYEEKLNDAEKALEVYSELLQKYPQAPFAANINSRLAELRQNADNYKRNNRPPVASDIVAANILSPSSVEITWQPNNENDFSNYRLVRSASAGGEQSGAVIAEITSRERVTYLDENLKEGNTYYYRLYIYDKGGLKSAGKEISVKVEAKQIMATISLQARTNNWFNVSLYWSSYNKPDFDSYKVYRSTTPGVSMASQLVKSIFDPSITQFSDTDVKDNTTYYYKVYVFNKDGANKPSNEATVVTPSNTPPQQVTLAPPKTIDPKTIELSWSSSNDIDFSMYRIYRAEKSPVSIESVPIWMNSNKEINRYRDTDLKSGKKYYYKVVVYDKGGLFAESNEVSIDR